MSVSGMPGVDPEDEGATALPSRRHLLRMGVAAAVGAAAGAELFSGTASANAGDAIEIDETTVGAGGTTVLEWTNGGSTVGSTFRAALQDWGGQVFNVLAYGATGNGTTDDTASIEAAQAEAGAGCVYFPAGTYLVDGLTIGTLGQTFKLEAGATLMAKAGISGSVIAVSAASVSIYGPGVIDGNESNQTGSTGLDGIRFSSTASDGLVQNVVIQNVTWIGIETDSAPRPRLALNRIINCNHAGISCTSGSTTTDGPIIVGNLVSLGGSAVVSGINVQGGSSTDLITNATVSENRVSISGVGSTGLAYQLSNCSYARLVTNWGTSPSQVFSVSGGNDNVVTANTALPTGNGSGIELGSNYAVCAGNTIDLQSGATGSGIHADNGSGTTVVIANNKITGAITCGIGVGSYDHVTITGNVIRQSSSATAGFSAIEVSPSGVGLITIGDNVCDAAAATSYGIWLNNLTSVAIQTSIHDNTITGIPSGSSNAAFRFAGAGVFTDLLVHDNTISSGTPIYTMAPGLSFGSNVLFHDNIVVGGAPGFGVAPITLPASGTPYTNPGPYTEMTYVQGGKLTGTGVVKNGRTLVPGSVVLKTPMALLLQPGESFTVNYTVAPAAWKDVKI